MTLVIGIDEAGYGPTLGPLVTSAAVFRTGSADCRLHEALSSVVTPNVCDKERLIINDSKKVFSRDEGGLARLEEAVLAFAAASGKLPRSPSELLRALGDGAFEDRSQCPWYGCLDRPIPTSADIARVRERAAALRKALGERSIEFVGLATRVIETPRFNAELARTGNKARVLFAAFARLLDGVLAATADEQVRVSVDRHGGRHYYQKALAGAWPLARIQVVREGPRESCYRMATAHGRTVDLSFAVGADGSSLPVGLASMASKYVRELSMMALNEWWARLVPGLAPTAGYPQDARRFLETIEPAIVSAGIDRRTLVRER
ncbi:MAG: hypothetical protein V2A58_11435 [Planctomycetota bacterium]